MTSRNDDEVRIEKQSTCQQTETYDIEVKILRADMTVKPGKKPKKPSHFRG